MDDYRILRDRDAVRPAETAADRLRWAGLDVVEGDDGIMLEAVDYRGQFVSRLGDLIRDDMTPRDEPPPYDGTGVRIGRLAVNAVGIYVLSD